MNAAIRQADTAGRGTDDPDARPRSEDIFTIPAWALVVPVLLLWHGPAIVAWFGARDLTSEVARANHYRHFAMPTWMSLGMMIMSALGRLLLLGSMVMFLMQAKISVRRGGSAPLGVSSVVGFALCAALILAWSWAGTHVRALLAG